MDFKSRLNSCGRFCTDENFKKIIMKNSTRLRQNSVLTKNDSLNISDTHTELNNIKVVKKLVENKPKISPGESEKKERKEIEKEKVNSQTENKKDKGKCRRHISCIIDKNIIENKPVNKNKKSSNTIFFYQDKKNVNPKANDKTINNISSINQIEKSFNNKYNYDNFSTEIKVKQLKVKDEPKKHIYNNSIAYNNSQKKRRNFLIKKLKNDLSNNLINNQTYSVNSPEKPQDNTFLGSSLFLDKKNKNKNRKAKEDFNTEIKIFKDSNCITKDNYKFYQKQQKIHKRNIYIHNSISLIPVEINAFERSFNHEKNIEEKENIITKEANNKKNSSISNKKCEDGIANAYIKGFFSELIDLSNGMEDKSYFDILVNNLNKKYIISYDSKSFPINNDRFVYCYKFFCALVTPLLFLSKDYNLYKYDSVKGRLFINQYIYSSLCYIGHNHFDISKIHNFVNKYSGSKKVPIIKSTTSFIKLIFDEKQEYEPLKNALIQLIRNIINESVENIIKILNNTILFCFNNKPREKLYYPFYKKKDKNQNQQEENSKISESSTSPPFIKTSMKKDFCLVLDIDETISHSLKLSFGYYFLLRPGALDFLNELSNYYEIDIFTSSLKLYADFIIDKIDFYGNLISYRLYKHHVIYERGKSVKKLNMIGRDLNKIIFVDNLKSNAKYNLKNLCQISSWRSDIYDDELIKLKNKLKYIATSGKYNDDITKGIN